MASNVNWSELLLREGEEGTGGTILTCQRNSFFHPIRNWIICCCYERPFCKRFDLSSCHWSLIHQFAGLNRLWATGRPCKALKQGVVTCQQSGSLNGKCSHVNCYVKHYMTDEVKSQSKVHAALEWPWCCGTGYKCT